MSDDEVVDDEMIDMGDDIDLGDEIDLDDEFGDEKDEMGINFGDQIEEE